jgi:hypothetical protein
VPLHQEQKPVGPDRAEFDIPHEEVGDHAPFHIEGIRRQFVDIRGISHIRMGDQAVACGGEQLANRTRIATVPADFGPDPGWNQENRIEIPLIALRPEPQIEESILVGGLWHLENTDFARKGVSRQIGDDEADDLGGFARMLFGGISQCAYQAGCRFVAAGFDGEGIFQYLHFKRGFFN